jgi:hypothetical protein
MGPFTHMVLARDHLPAVFEHFGLESSPRLIDAACLGAVAPDAGYYPGADVRLSITSHQNKPWDMAQAMLHFSQTPGQKAFSLGWLSHILADWRGHREVVIPAVGRDSARSPLEHQRLEWGIDCRMLSAEQNAWLWRLELKTDLGLQAWHAALVHLYGQHISISRIQAGLRRQVFILSKLPGFFMLTGSACKPDANSAYQLARLLGRPLSRGFARIGHALRLSKEVCSLADPRFPQETVLNSLQRLYRLHSDDLHSVLMDNDAKPADFKDQNEDYVI